MHPAVRYTRHGEDLKGSGLFLDVPAWHHHVFALETQSSST
jgi:hypothetical protein